MSHLKQEQVTLSLKNYFGLFYLFIMRLHHFVGGSTGPGYSLMRFDLLEKKLAWPKWHIFHPGYVLPSNVVFTSDGASLYNVCPLSSWFLVKVFFSPRSISGFKLSFAQVFSAQNFEKTNVLASFSKDFWVNRILMARTNNEAI